jgi:hypothetical protein
MNASRKFPFWTTTAFIVALIGNLVAAAFLVVPLFLIPSGTGVRLLWGSFESSLASVGTVVLVILLSIMAWRREHYRLATIPILFFALTPWFFSGWAMRLVASARGIFLEP